MKKKPRRFFHYQQFVPDHVTSMLQDSKVKFSKIADFNDPWDSKPFWRTPQNAVEVAALKAYLHDAYLQQGSSTSPVKRAFAIYGATGTPDNIKKFLIEHQHQMFKQINAKYRVYALTEAADSILMWSHYGKNHTGICFEFDSVAHPFNSAEKIEYLEEYPAFDITSEGYKALLTKAMCWEYEKEWRLIAEEIGPKNSNFTIKAKNGFVTFDPETLTSITIGAMCSGADRKTLNEIIRKFRPNLLVRQAEIEPEKYSLRVTPVISLNPAVGKPENK